MFSETAENSQIHWMYEIGLAQCSKPLLNTYKYFKGPMPGCFNHFASKSWIFSNLTWLCSFMPLRPPLVQHKFILYIFRAYISIIDDFYRSWWDSDGIVMRYLVIGPMLAISQRNRQRNRLKIIKIIAKFWFFKIELETFLGHLGGVGWSPAWENRFWNVFSSLPMKFQESWLALILQGIHTSLHVHVQHLNI